MVCDARCAVAVAVVVVIHFVTPYTRIVSNFSDIYQLLLSAEREKENTKLKNLFGVSNVSDRMFRSNNNNDDDNDSNKE